MPEIPLKTSRAIICKKKHESYATTISWVLCTFAERALMPMGIENPDKEELSLYTVVEPSSDSWR